MVGLVVRSEFGSFGYGSESNRVHGSFGSHTPKGVRTVRTPQLPDFSAGGMHGRA